MFYQGLSAEQPFLAVRRLAASVAGFPALWPVGLTHAQNEDTDAVVYERVGVDDLNKLLHEQVCGLKNEDTAFHLSRKRRYSQLPDRPRRN